MSKSTATLINKESFIGIIKSNDDVAKTTNICHACGQKLPKTSSSSQRVDNDDEEDNKRQPPNFAESRLEKNAKYLSETEDKIRKIDEKLDAVIDPLEEYSDASLAAKPKINSTKRSRLLDPKQSARSLSFTDSDDENVSPSSPCVKIRRIQKKRRRFTNVEKNAIIKGVEKFGKGQWAKIKNEYKAILVDRTGVNIKDCYRTMLGNDEIDQKEHGNDEIDQKEHGNDEIDQKEHEN
eukprot:CAMPEP_0194371042 /NCGR_PEP_ID=MMETSP0174-20130528/19397_1 /TAXON_ID=216777 /ORGANISM="Proboscia alata, Strain PI-D3" /LENGTH=236 /DNA_ID=CAMNT_0039148857 /DNA_START=40 /DNA_END=747 /DNA_ORIENTATION=+